MSESDAGAGLDAGAARRGVLMVALAGVFWSLQGPAIRMIEVANGEQIVFWRSIGQFFGMLLIVAVVNRGQVARAFRSAGYRAVIGGCCHLVAGTCFVFAVVHTTVANVVFTLAASPLVAAGVAWLLLRERIEARTLVAMTAAIAGIAVMMSEGLASGTATGTLLALATTFGFAGMAVVARWGGGVNMLPAVCIGAVLTNAVGWLMTGGDVAVPLPDMLYALASGGFLTAIGAALFMSGAKFVPAGVLAFLSLTEIVLAPIWVWAAFDEVPSGLTLVGGAIVLTALATEGVLRVRGAG